MSESRIGDALAPEVRELLEVRSSVQKWLAGLEAQRGTASDRILQKVRADYEDRLARANEALSAHVAGIQAEMDRAAERSVEAERVHDDAVDALEEARLRRAIGELPEEGWADREGSLMEEVKRAKIAEDAARTEADRLRELLRTLSSEERGTSSAAAEDVPVSGHPQAVDSDAAGMSTEAGSAAGSNEEVAAFDAGYDDADATVESGSSTPMSDLAPPAAIEIEAPRSMQAEEQGSLDAPVQREREVMPREAPGLFDADDIPGPEKAPPPGLKCTECGYTNDLSAWFCGVCGADVG